MIEKSVICDMCSIIIAADRTVAAARAQAEQQCGAIQIGGIDLCRDCAFKFREMRRIEKAQSSTINP